MPGLKSFARDHTRQPDCRWWADNQAGPQAGADHRRPFDTSGQAWQAGKPPRRRTPELGIIRQELAEAGNGGLDDPDQLEYAVSDSESRLTDPRTLEHREITSL